MMVIPRTDECLDGNTNKCVDNKYGNTTHRKIYPDIKKKKRGKKGNGNNICPIVKNTHNKGVRERV